MRNFAAALLCIFAVAHAASGPSGPAELNDKLVVSATGAPWKIVSSTDLHYHMQGNNATAFDHDDMHNHVVAHYKKADAKDELPEPSALASISPQVAKPLDKQREAEVAAGVKKLEDEEKESKKEDLEVISMAKAKTDSKPALDVEEEATNKERQSRNPRQPIRLKVKAQIEPPLKPRETKSTQKSLLLTKRSS